MVHRVGALVACRHDASMLERAFLDPNEGMNLEKCAETSKSSTGNSFTYTVWVQVLLLVLYLHGPNGKATRTKGPRQTIRLHCMHGWAL